LVGIAVGLVQIALLMGAAIPGITYWIHPETFAAACENRDRPAMRCCGKCKLRKATAAALGVGGGPTLRGDRDPVPSPVDSRLETVAFFEIATHELGVFQVASDRPTDFNPSPDPPPPKV
jgi:hypothetical protein